MSTTKYTHGVDLGTLSGRAMVMDVTDGREIAAVIHEYADSVR